jgi:hypothetical protein
VKGKSKDSSLQRRSNHYVMKQRLLPEPDEFYFVCNTRKDVSKKDPKAQQSEFEEDRRFTVRTQERPGFKLCTTIKKVERPADPSMIWLVNLCETKVYPSQMKY